MHDFIGSQFAHQNGSAVVPWLGVSDEANSGVLYTVQRSDGRLGKACEHNVAVIEFKNHWK